MEIDAFQHQAGRRHRAPDRAIPESSEHREISATLKTVPALHISGGSGRPPLPASTSTNRRGSSKLRNVNGVLGAYRITDRRAAVEREAGEEGTAGVRPHLHQDSPACVKPGRKGN